MTGEREFHLGIIGGCMARQPGMHICRLFEYELARLLRASTGAALVPHVSRYAEGEYAPRFRELAAAWPLDGVLLHVRTAVLRKTGVIVKHLAPGVTTQALHPMLVRIPGRRGLSWDEIETSGFDGCLRTRRFGKNLATPPTPEEAQDEPPPKVLYEIPPSLAQFRGVTFGQVNRALGRLFGLDSWAIEDEIREVGLVRDFCAKQGIPLIVLGPLPAPHAAWIESYNRRVRERLARDLPAMGVEYRDISSGQGKDPMSVVMGDGRHLMDEGHGMVARALHDPIAAWIRAG